MRRGAGPERGALHGNSKRGRRMPDRDEGDLAWDSQLRRGQRDGGGAVSATRIGRFRRLCPDRQL